MINIFERRRYLIILVTILYFTGIFEQIFNNKNILDFLSSKTFVISTIIYIICVAFVVRLISSAKKIKKLSNKITSGNFINNLEEAKPREPYDKATYEIIDSFSKKISEEKSSVIELENIISSIKFGLMVIENKENTKARAVSAFSPPESCDNFVFFFPGSLAIKTKPLSSESSNKFNFNFSLGDEIDVRIKEARSFSLTGELYL